MNEQQQPFQCAWCGHLTDREDWKGSVAHARTCAYRPEHILIKSLQAIKNSKSLHPTYLRQLAAIGLKRYNDLLEQGGHTDNQRKDSDNNRGDPTSH